MRELSLDEINEVQGGLTPQQGAVLIGGCVLLASVVAAPAAAAFGGGVLFAMAVGDAWA